MVIHGISTSSRWFSTPLGARGPTSAFTSWWRTLGPMDKFRAAIARTLGIPAQVARAGTLPDGGGGGEPGDFAPVIDARRFSPYTRKRVFFSTLLPARDLWSVRGGRPPPWGEGWEGRSTGGLGPLKDMPPIMRGRGPCPGVRPSAYQFHPDFLLYSGSMPNVAHYRIVPAITLAMPKHVREGFCGIMASRKVPGGVAHDPGREHKIDATAQWMHENRATLGFRAPRATERARAYPVAPKVYFFRGGVFTCIFRGENMRFWR